MAEHFKELPCHGRARRGSTEEVVSEILCSPQVYTSVELRVLAPPTAPFTLASQVPSIVHRWEHGTLSGGDTLTVWAIERFPISFDLLSELVTVGV